MTDLLDKFENIQLLENLVSGKAVSVNISSLSRILNKHRNTIKKKVKGLFENKIIDHPICPFIGIYKIFPLLAIINMDIPDRIEGSGIFERWVREDPQIFAAFKSGQSEYDTTLFTYHENITSYQIWMMELPTILKLHYGVPEEYAQFVSSASYFSNQLMIKYNPSTGINLIEQDFKENDSLRINGYSLDELDIKIIRCLVSGKGLKINYKLLEENTKLHRKTVEKRISNFIEEGLLLEPVCRFPNFYVPPQYLLTLSLIEIKHLKEQVMRDMILDPHIPIALQTIYGKYNLVLLGNHKNINDHYRWESKYTQKYPDSFKGIHTTYLTQDMTISFSHQIVSLCYLRQKMKHFTQRDLTESIRSSARARYNILHKIARNQLIHSV